MLALYSLQMRVGDWLGVELPEELQGIPLTRGLLEKAGFRKMSDDIYIYYRYEEGDYYEVFINFDREEETTIEVIKQKYFLFSRTEKITKSNFFTNFRIYFSG